MDCIEKQELLDTYIKKLPRTFGIELSVLSKGLGFEVTEEMLEKTNDILPETRIILQNGKVIIFSKQDNSSKICRKTYPSYYDSEEDYIQSLISWNKNTLKNYKKSKFYKLLKRNEEKKTELYSVFSIFHFQERDLPLHTDGSNHEYEKVVMQMKDDWGYEVSFFVYHCSKCNKFFMDDKMIDFAYSRTENKLAIPFRSEGYDGKWRTELTNLGYNVQNNELSEQQRHTILYLAIKNSDLTKEQVIENLQYFLNTFGENEQNQMAKKKWEKDLEYVTNTTIIPSPKRYKIYYNWKKK